MAHVGTPGQVVVLNGAPRSGKSSIAAVIQNTFDGVWMNLGVDRFKPTRLGPSADAAPLGHTTRASSRVEANGASCPDRSSADGKPVRNQRTGSRPGLGSGTG